MQLKVGVAGHIAHEVRPEDLATAWRNDMPVLATPILLWLSEIASMAAIEGHLPEAAMTLGYEHRSRHLAPTPVGWTVRLRAKLIQVDGKLLFFEVEASDDNEVVFLGTHIRAIVDRDRFRTHVNQKSSGITEVQHQPIAGRRTT